MQMNQVNVIPNPVYPNKVTLFANLNNPQIRKSTPYQQKVLEVKHRLKSEGSSLIQWGKDHGYTENQMYMASRRSFACGFGVTRKIAEQVGFIAMETNNA